MRNNPSKTVDLFDKYMKRTAYYVKRVYVGNNVVSVGNPGILLNGGDNICVICRMKMCSEGLPRPSEVILAQ